MGLLGDALAAAAGVPCRRLLIERVLVPSDMLATAGTEPQQRTNRS